MKLQYSFIGVLLLLLVSCTHKELCRDHRHPVKVTLEVEWPYPPDTAQMTLRVLFYPLGGGMPLIYDLAHAAGGTITVPSGDYQVLLLNSDTENLLYRQLSQYQGITAYVSETLEPADARNPRLHEPDPLWLGKRDLLHINACLPQQTIHFIPAMILSRYRVEARFSSGISSLIRNLKASVSCLSSGCVLESGAAIGDVGTYAVPLFPLGAAPAQDEVCWMGEFLCFGVPPHGRSRHFATLLLDLGNGRKFRYRVEVTRQIGQASNPKFVTIVLESLPDPVPIDVHGGFEPDVGGWEIIQIDLPI